MAIKYFCDRCGKEADIWDTPINVNGKEFDASLCQECLDKLKSILRDFFQDYEI